MAKRKIQAEKQRQGTMLMGFKLELSKMSDILFEKGICRVADEFLCLSKEESTTGFDHYCGDVGHYFSPDSNMTNKICGNCKHWTLIKGGV